MYSVTNTQIYADLLVFSCVCWIRFVDIGFLQVFPNITVKINCINIINIGIFG